MNIVPSSLVGSFKSEDIKGCVQKLLNINGWGNYNLCLASYEFTTVGFNEELQETDTAQIDFILNGNILASFDIPPFKNYSDIRIENLEVFNNEGLAIVVQSFQENTPTSLYLSGEALKIIDSKISNKVFYKG